MNPAVDNSARARPQAGVTLIELTIVVTIIAIGMAVAFPALSSGIDSLRMNEATDSVATFFNAGLSRAERQQQIVEITISRTENHLSMISTDPAFKRDLALPEGIRIEKLLPDTDAIEDTRQRQYALFPGGAIPAFGVQLVNQKGARRIVRVDPITGVPQVENL